MGYVEKNSYAPDKMLYADIDGRRYEASIKELGSLE